MIYKILKLPALAGRAGSERFIRIMSKH